MAQGEPDHARPCKAVSGVWILFQGPWEDTEGYVEDNVYHGGSFQTKICWLSGEIEYNYYISKKNDLSFAIVHSNPESMGFAIGIKHWISRKSSHCNTCPSFH